MCHVSFHAWVIIVFIYYLIAEELRQVRDNRDPLK